MQDFFRIALSIEQHIESGKLWLQTPYCILLYPAAKLFISIVSGTLSNRKINEAWPYSFENTHKFVIKIPKYELVATLSSTLVKTFGYFKHLFIFNLFLKENEGCDVPFDWVAVCGSTSTTINIIELL